MKKLCGVTVAMVTPFDDNGKLDIQAAKALTEYLVSSKVNGLYPCGTTGEMLHLRTEERMRLLEGIIEQNQGRAAVYAQVGAATTKEAVELARHARAAGADGIGVVTPQFFKVTEEEMVDYYRTVAQAAEGLPVYLYNIPQCSANDLLPGTCRKILSDCENVIGIKYSFGDMARTVEYLNISRDRFDVMHGMDKIFASLLVMGCKGTVSGCAGVFPEPYVNVYQAYLDKDMEAMEHWQRIAVEIGDALHNGENMAYFKEALDIRGIRVGGMRAPQKNLPDKERDMLKKRLAEICAKENIALKIGGIRN